MKLSEHWLREWVNPSLNTKDLAELLTMAGLEVDAIEPAAAEFNGVCVGKVVSTMAHPDATKLTLCKVDIGTSELLDIVCGAANVREGLHVAVATVGAKLPGGLKINKAKLRGEVSLGMLCSASELGLSDTSTGIMEFPNESPIGVCVRKFLTCDDAIIEIDLTPNRGDCLSVRGLAREVSALTNVPWRDLEQDVVAIDSKERIIASIDARQHCAQYVCRIVSDIDASACVPLWMSERLRRSGLRPHSLAVDITNYVMMELGQPLHAFDADKVSGALSVRLSVKGELLILLNEQTIELKPGTLVIADEHKVLAMAGVMGGLDSSVTSLTKRILLESAYFVPEKIAGVARSYGLATDSAHRFERGVAPDLQQKAIERATSLLQRFGGGIASEITVVTEPNVLPTARELALTTTKVNRLLGTSLTNIEIQNYLMRLGMTIKKDASDKGVCTVSVPAFRFDVSIEEDLIEEVARVYGYEAIPLSPIRAQFQAHKKSELTLNVETLRQTLADFGYSEAINYSFVCPKKQALVYQNEQTTELINPLSKELSQMRQGLMVGLLNAFSSNLARQVSSQKLFEIGLCFEKVNGSLLQINRVAGLLSGSEGENDWSMTKRNFDFYDLKGDIERLLVASLPNITFEACEHSSFHPGKSAVIKKEGTIIGYMGELHPSLVKSFSLSKTPFLFEIDVEPLLEKPLPSYQKLSKYPFISRDMSFVLDETVSFYDVAQCVRGVSHEVPLKSLSLFDVYQGDNIEKGKKSMAIGLQLQHLSRTLVDGEVNDYMSAILKSLENEFDITLRE